jgi:hypothetical protein
MTGIRSSPSAELGHLGHVGIARHVEERLLAAGVVEATRDLHRDRQGGYGDAGSGNLMGL